MQLFACTAAAAAAAAADADVDTDVAWKKESIIFACSRVSIVRRRPADDEGASVYPLCVEFVTHSFDLFHNSTFGSRSAGSVVVTETDDQKLLATTGLKTDF
jgi:hypothetical protein